MKTAQDKIPTSHKSMNTNEKIAKMKAQLVDEVSGYPAYSFILEFLEKEHIVAQIYSYKSYNFKEVVKFIKKHFEISMKLGLDKLDNPLNGATIILAGPNVSFMLAKTDLAIYAKSVDDILVFEEFITQFAIEEDNTELYKYVTGKGYVFETDSSQPIYKRVFPQLYPDIDIKQLSENFLASKESILILYGDPGVGKTSFVKYLYALGKLNRVFLLQSLELATSPTAINEIPGAEGEASSKDLLFLDDIDVLLAARDQKNDEKNSMMMSTFLSMTDSIKIPPKVILTTNVSIKEIDSAIIRPGRCFDFIHVRPMEFNYALQTAISDFNLTEEQFRKRFTKEEPVYQSHFMELVDDLASISRPTYYRNPEDDIPVSKKLQRLNINVKNMSSGKEETKMIFANKN